MTDETPPPSPLPPASQPPFPAHPAPKAQGEAPLPDNPKAVVPAGIPGIGTFGFTLLGGALAAAVGVMVVRPLLRKRRDRSSSPATAKRGRRKAG